MVQPNTLAKLWVSAEDVFVLAVTGNEVTVRRPVGTNDGIKHLTETFTLPEVVSTEEFRARELADRLAMKQQVTSATQGAEPHGLFQVQ